MAQKNSNLGGFNGSRQISSVLGLTIIIAFGSIAGLLIWSNWNAADQVIRESVTGTVRNGAASQRKKQVPAENAPVVENDGQPVAASDFDAEISAMEKGLGEVADSDFGDGELSDSNLGM